MSKIRVEGKLRVCPRTGDADRFDDRFAHRRGVKRPGSAGSKQRYRSVIVLRTLPRSVAGGAAGARWTKILVFAIDVVVRQEEGTTSKLVQLVLLSRTAQGHIRILRAELDSHELQVTLSRRRVFLSLGVVHDWDV
jgi:hypothetical protein